MLGIGQFPSIGARFPAGVCPHMPGETTANYGGLLEPGPSMAGAVKTIDPAAVSPGGGAERRRDGATDLSQDVGPSTRGACSLMSASILRAASPREALAGRLSCVLPESGDGGRFSLSEVRFEQSYRVVPCSGGVMAVTAQVVPREYRVPELA